MKWFFAITIAMKSNVLSIMRLLQKLKKLIQSFFRTKDAPYILEVLAG